MQILKKNEYIWAVTYESIDGDRLTKAYFTSHADAQKFSKSYKWLLFQTPQVVQTTLWKDSEDNWYKVDSINQVQVDQEIHKKNALDKLTQQEKQALGLV